MSFQTARRHTCDSCVPLQHEAKNGGTIHMHCITPDSVDAEASTPRSHSELWVCATHPLLCRWCTQPTKEYSANKSTVCTPLALCQRTNAMHADGHNECAPANHVTFMLFYARLSHCALDTRRHGTACKVCKRRAPAVVTARVCPSREESDSTKP